jgi:hypothetical protein
MADLPSNLGGIHRADAAPARAWLPLLPGFAVGDVRSVNADLDAAVKARGPKPSHRSLQSSDGPELHQPWASARPSARLHRPQGLRPHVSG